MSSNNVQGKGQEVDEFKEICEGCGKFISENDMSDVMEMYICNSCEDGVREIDELEAAIDEMKKQPMSNSDALGCMERKLATLQGS